MAIRLVTLDCAGTLLQGAWEPVRFALDAAERTGLVLPPHAASDYAGLLEGHYPAILSANHTGELAAVREAYVRLGETWLAGLGLDPDRAAAVVDAALARLTASEDGLFRPFPDALPFLRALRERGVRIAVVSNWDATLPSVLRAHGLDRLVDEAYASLVVGAEKPDPTMLRLAMDSVGATPEETLHVGDDPTDDLGAAAAAGVCGLLLQREDSAPDTIGGLMEALRWID